MKNRKMLTLKNKIFLSYVGLCFGLVVLFKNLDYIYYEILDPMLNPDVKDLDVNTPSRWGYFVFSILIFVVFAFVFYRLTARAIKQESERRLQEQNLIYAAIAHDLKTPMTSVQGFAKALSDGKIKPDEQQEIFDIIYRKSNSMNDMVNTLFDYAKLGTEGYEPALAEIDVCAFVRDIIAENYCDFEDHGIGLDIDIPDGAIMINADKSELKRAVTNLIVNVYKHNPDGIRAKISVCKDNNRAEIKIADSGEPLPEGVDIFEPFVTENTARTVGHGTGLGLAVTKRVIERHGGEVKVVQAGEGYTKAFEISMQCWDGHAKKSIASVPDRYSKL